MVLLMIMIQLFSLTLEVIELLKYLGLLMKIILINLIEYEYQMFIMQECLRSLEGEQLRQARQYIREVLQEITPLEKNPEASAKKNLLLKLAQKHFERTCKVLNFLIDIHVLT